MGMGLSVTLNPNGVGLQTALKGPLLSRDTPNVLGGFVSAMGSMQGGAGIGGGPFGPLGMGPPPPPAPTAATGGGAVTGLLAIGGGNTSITTATTTGVSPSNVVSSISNKVSKCEESSNSTKVAIESSATPKVDSVNTMLKNMDNDMQREMMGEKSESCLSSNFAEVNSAGSTTGNTAPGAGDIQAVTVDSDGSIQGLSVKQNQTTSIASSVILGIGVVREDGTAQKLSSTSIFEDSSTSLNPGNSKNDVKRKKSDDGSGASISEIDVEVTNRHPLVNESKNQMCNNLALSMPVSESNFDPRRSNQNPDSPAESDKSDVSLVPIIV